MDRNLRIRMLLEASERVTQPLRDIAGGSTRAAQALKATRDRLTDLKAAQANVAGFRQLKTGLRATETELQQAQARVAELARQMQAAESPSKRLTADFTRAQRAARRLKEEHRDQSERLQQLRGRLSEAGGSASSLAAHERRLRDDIARTNGELAEQQRRLQQVSDRAQRFRNANERAGKLQNAATGLAAGGFSAIQTGETLGRPVLGAIGQAMEYQSVMTDIAQKADLGRDQAAKMGVGLLQAARAANQLPSALQEGVDTLAGFGLDPQKAVAMMTPIGRAATAYKAQINDLSAAAFAATDNLKVPVDQTARVIDVMAQAGKSGAFEIKDMAQYFPTLTAGYQALGQKGVGAVGDLAAALQIARKGAGDSASAATNVANLIQKMASPDTIRNFAKFGVDLPAALKKAYAEGKTPIEAITELTGKTLKGDLSKVGFLFGDAQVQQALRPLVQNLDEYKRIRAEALGASGVTDKDFAERMQDSAEKAKRFRIQLQATGIMFGGLLLPAATRLLGVAGDLANRFSGWAERNPAFAKGLAYVAAGLAGLFIVLGGGAIAIAGILAPFSALAWAAGALDIALLPLIGTAAAVVAGIVLLAGAAYLIYSNWGAITGWFSGVWQTIVTAFNGGIGGIVALLVNFSPVGLLYQGFAALVNWLGGSMPKTLSEAGYNMIAGLVKGMLGALGWVKNAVTSIGTSAVNWFKQTLGIHSPSRVFMGLGGYVMQGLTNGIADGEDGPINRLTGLSKKMGAAIAIGSAVPAIATPGLPAGGGTGSAVAPGAAPAPIGPITININAAPGQSAESIGEAVRRELEKLQRTAGTGQGASYHDAPDLGDMA